MKRYYEESAKSKELKARILVNINSIPGLREAIDKVIARETETMQPEREALADSLRLIAAEYNALCNVRSDDYFAGEEVLYAKKDQPNILTIIRSSARLRLPEHPH